MELSLIRAILVASSLLSGPAFSHPGGLNAEGCHNNRKTGDYHCHRAPSNKAPTVRNRTGANLPPASNAGSPYYSNCSAARAAGAAPIRRGEPGYGSHLDRDNDGVACE